MRCWGENRFGQSSPQPGPGRVAQIVLGNEYSCALRADGRVRCWGRNDLRQSLPPSDLDRVVQIDVGYFHGCALTDLGEVHCWGSNRNAQLSPPADLGPVARLVLGDFYSCAVTVSGQLRCWGELFDISSLPPNSVTEISASGQCALLTEGSVYCPRHPHFAPPDLRAVDVVMSVWPLQLSLGERAAIRFGDLRDTAGAFTARIEVFGEGSADIGSSFRLLDRDGTTPLVAEEDGSYLLEGQAGEPPMAWLEYSGRSKSALAYVRPLELLLPLGSASGSTPSIRMVAQPIELAEVEDGLFLTASTDTLTEGGEEVQLSIVFPLDHVGLRVEMDFAVSGTVLAGSDYTLVTADPAPGITISGGASDEIMLRVDSAPLEELLLRLRPRAEDRISQGDRLLNLRPSRYQVTSGGGGTADLPPALKFILRDDKSPAAPRLDGLFLTASTDTLTEGGEEVQISILFPLDHVSLPVEMDFAVSGTALAGLDYTLVTADPAPGITISGGASDVITLRVDSAPLEEVRLRLRPRADDRINQGGRLLNLLPSRYQVTSGSGGQRTCPRHWILFYATTNRRWCSSYRCKDLTISCALVWVKYRCAAGGMTRSVMSRCRRVWARLRSSLWAGSIVVR